MTNHLRFAGKSDLRTRALADIVAASPTLTRTLQIARDWNLTD